MFDGDSVAAGQPDASFAWHVQFQLSVNAYLSGAGSASATFANVAVGGSTTADILAGVATLTAQNPDHVWVHCGINDHFNHGGTAIPPATSATTAAAYIAAIKAARPSCKIHWLEGCWYGGEARPDGSSPDDAAVIATNAAIRTVVQATSGCEWLAIRSFIRGAASLVYNPTNLSTGGMTQDGTHPNKTGGLPAFNTAVFNLTTFGL